MKKIKQFLIENGFQSAIALFIGVGAFVLGHYLITSAALGYFVGRNLVIIKNLYKQYLNEKVKDVVSKVIKK